MAILAVTRINPLPNPLVLREGESVDSPLAMEGKIFVILKECVEIEVSQAIDIHRDISLALRYDKKL
ncbi:hypothetical protein [Helicobacter sp. T3_23-1059]